MDTNLNWCVVDGNTVKKLPPGRKLEVDEHTYLFWVDATEEKTALMEKGQFVLFYSWGRNDQEKQKNFKRFQSVWGQNYRLPPNDGMEVRSRAAEAAMRLVAYFHNYKVKEVRPKTKWLKNPGGGFYYESRAPQVEGGYGSGCDGPTGFCEMGYSEMYFEKL